MLLECGSAAQLQMCCAESWVLLIQTRTSRLISQLSCWATIRFDLWIDFLHWPWTFLIAMNLPDDMDSLLGLARISRFSLWWDGPGWWGCGDPLGILSCRLSCCVVLLQIGDGQEDRPLFAWVMNKPDHSKYDVFPRNIPSFCSPMQAADNYRYMFCADPDNSFARNNEGLCYLSVILVPVGSLGVLYGTFPFLFSFLWFPWCRVMHHEKHFDLDHVSWYLWLLQLQTLNEAFASWLEI